MTHPWIGSRARRALAVLCLATALFTAGVAEAADGPSASAASPADTEDAFAAAAGAQAIFPLSEVKRGQRGYGLSVFSGTEPERFEVEVYGVVRNFSPEVSYILARLSGKGLETSGVAGGMSGSPVFLDGRLVGAVAFSWPFTNEAIAGITPIEYMRKISAFKPLPVSPPPPSIRLSDLMAHRLPENFLATEMAKLQPRLAGGALPAIQWTAAGFGEQSLGMLRQALGSVAPSGTAAPGSVPDDLSPGRAVSVVLVDGDFELASNGTVTDKYGDHVLAFGHHFLGLGPIKVPMATAEIVTVISSQNSSFKIANAGRIIGAFEQDRLVGIQGRIGAEAPMVPMTIKIKGERERVFRMRLADLPEFMPLLVGSSIVAGLDSATFVNGSQSLDMTARLRLSGYGDLEVGQSFDGGSAGVQASSYVLAIVSYLAQNPLEQVRIESIDVELAQSTDPQAASLVGANADRTVVRPGDRVALNLDFVPYRGDRFRRSLGLDLPEDLPAGRYSLLVGDGASIDAARLAMAPAEPVTLPQALDLMRSFHSRRDLVVLGVYSGAGLSVAGEVMPRLPGSVRSLWGAAASGSATALRTAIAQEKVERMDVPIQGLVRIDLEVRRRQPLAGEKGGEPPPGALTPNPSPSPPATPAGERGKGSHAAGSELD